ncbi:hypothetical protein [Burkholderia sp. BCC0397]|uniref:hypothetical protein n=1 Tax=Burkholderia sp. BCC0397 TaxID=486876 RepID=UPI00158E80EB|nr:hypothetical protein [Burkholderia sp. BCC0397]
MKPVDRFALATHDGPYETWPARTHVLVDGVRSGLAVAGYVRHRDDDRGAWDGIGPFRKNVNC